MSRAADHTAPAILGEETISPLRVYTAKELATILGVKRVQSVYEIPESELPRVRRVGRSHGYLGVNVLAYLAGVPPVDVAAAVEGFRAKLLAERPQVQPLRSADTGRGVDGERRRIM